MTTAALALLISICALVISAANLFWNIWSKFIHPRPKLRVSFAVKIAVDNFGKSPDFLGLDVTNLGPSAVVITSVAIRKKKRWIPFQAKPLIGVLMPASTPNAALSKGGGTGNWIAVPKKLEVAESSSFYFPMDTEGLTEFDRIGVYDSFGRYHPAPRRDFEGVRKSILAGKG